jgi:alcohol dehydrogenase
MGSGRARAAVLAAVGNVEMRSFEIPRYETVGGLLKTALAGICRTDIELYNGRVRYGDLPLVLGHEIVGSIEEVTRESAERWRVDGGDLVIVEGKIRCGSCRMCIVGDFRYCEAKMGYGTFTSATQFPGLWGGYASHVHLGDGAVIHKVPGGMSAEAALIAAVPLANAVEWLILEGGLRLGGSVVIQGPGPIGLSAVAVARMAGAGTVIVTGRDRDADRLEVASELGADHTLRVGDGDVTEAIRDVMRGAPVDLVLDLTGDPSAIRTSLAAVGTRGRVVNAGLCGDLVETSVALDSLIYRSVDARFVYSSSYEAIEIALKVVERAPYDLGRLVTHTYPLDQANAVLAALDHGASDGETDPRGPMLKCALVP